MKILIALLSVSLFSHAAMADDYIPDNCKIQAQAVVALSRLPIDAVTPRGLRVVISKSGLADVTFKNVRQTEEADKEFPNTYYSADIYFQNQKSGTVELASTREECFVSTIQIY